jgi:hypothetical protein
MKCLPLQDAGPHALIQNSANAQTFSQKFTDLNSVPTPKTGNTSARLLHAKLAKLKTLSLLEMEPVPVTSLNAVLAKFAKMEHALRDPLLAHFLARGNVLEVKSALMENASDNPLLADVLQSDVIEELFAETGSASNHIHLAIVLM